MILCRLRVKQDLRDSYFVDLIVVRAGLLIGKEMDSPWTLDSVDLIVLASSAFSNDANQAKFSICKLEMAALYAFFIPLYRAGL